MDETFRTRFTDEEVARAYELWNEYQRKLIHSDLGADIINNKFVDTDEATLIWN